MRNIDIKVILEKHKKWLNSEKDGRCANLGDADLGGAYLRDANLRDANLRDADLRGADLRGAYLRGAYLGGAYISGADFRDADLGGANLRGAYLRGAYLSGANLECANLECANLGGAYLRGAYLSGAYLNVKIPPTNSHYFIAEILFRESKNFKERSWAGSIQLSIDWCWDDFKENCPKSMIAWAKKILCSKWTEFEEKFK